MVFTVSPAKPRALPDENRLVYIARLNPAGHGLRFPGVASSLPAGDTFVPGAGAARGGGTRHAHLRRCLAFRGASVVGRESPSVAVSVDVRAQEMDPGNHRQTGGLWLGAAEVSVPRSSSAEGGPPVRAGVREVPLTPVGTASSATEQTASVARPGRTGGPRARGRDRTSVPRPGRHTGSS